MADLLGPLTARENSTHVARSVALALPSLIPPSRPPHFPLAYQSANGIASFTAAALHLDSVCLGL